MTQDYYGTKRVTAWPQPRYEAKAEQPEPGVTDLREIPGYAVRYSDGYESWSPKVMFEAAYKPITAMGFEGALAAMKAGHKVKRAIWKEVALYIRGQEIVCGIAGHLTWTPTHDNLLAEDWMIVE